MSATSVAVFLERDMGILNIKYSGNIIKYISRHSDERVIYKQLIYKNKELKKIESNPSKTEYWEVDSYKDGNYKIIYGTRGVPNPEFTKIVSLSKEQVEHLAEDDVAELPNYL